MPKSSGSRSHGRNHNHSSRQGAKPPESRSSKPAASGKVQSYTLQGEHGRINYVGTTNNPARRAAEHQASGKPGGMKVETPKLAPKAAGNWETNRLKTYRNNHGGQNPSYNQTRDGKRHPREKRQGA